MIAHITTQRDEYGIPVRTGCVALEVSESWYYKHRDGDTITATEQRRERLTEAIWERGIRRSGLPGPLVSGEARAGHQARQDHGSALHPRH